MPSGWDSPTQQRQFVASQFPIAQKWSAQTGIPPEVFIAIAISESNWGQAPGNMLFGIKGPGASVQTQTGPASFRSYASPDAAYADFVDLVSTMPRYAPAWAAAQRGDWRGFLGGLQAGGYAGNATAEDRNWSTFIGKVAETTVAPLIGGGANGVTPVATAAAVPAASATAPSPYVFPVQGYGGAVQQHWGEVRGGSDIFAPAGTPVVAMRGGVVQSAVTAANGGVGGNNVTIRGDDGLTYYYAHGDRAPAVQAGQPVAAGAYLFGVGQTGNAAGKGDMLHIGIGPTIRHGADKYGGTGGDFDAVTLLQAAQRGTAAAPATAQTGGARMPNTPATATVDPTLQLVVQNAASDLQASRDRIAALQTQLANVQPNPNNPQAAALERNSLASQIEEEQKNANTLLSRYVSAQELIRKSSTSTAMSPAEQGGLALGYAKELRESASDAQAAQEHADTLQYNYVNLAYGNQKWAADFTAGLLKENNANFRAWMADQVERGKIGIEAAQNKIDTFQKQQSLELNRLGVLSTTAEWMDKANFRNAQATLPADVQYVPTMGPNDPLTAALNRIGLPGVAIKVQKVDPSLIAPERAWGQAASVIPSVAAPDTTAYDAAVTAVGNIPSWTPQTMTPEQFGVGSEGMPAVSYTPPAPGAGAGAGAGAGTGVDPRLDAFISSLLYGPPGAGDTAPGTGAPGTGGPATGISVAGIGPINTGVAPATSGTFTPDPARYWVPQPSNPLTRSQQENPELWKPQPIQETTPEQAAQIRNSPPFAGLPAPSFSTAPGAAAPQSQSQPPSIGPVSAVGGPVAGAVQGAGQRIAAGPSPVQSLIDRVEADGSILLRDGTRIAASAAKKFLGNLPVLAGGR